MSKKNKKWSWSRVALSAFVATACWGTAWAAGNRYVAAPPVSQGDNMAVTDERSPSPIAMEKSNARYRPQHEAIVDVHSKDMSAVVVQKEPPAPKNEAVPMKLRPSEDYVWVPGYWQWDTDRGTYLWVKGAWRRQVPGMAWNAGRWDRTDKGYVWTAGFWAPEKAAGTGLVVAKMAPPAPKAEVEPASPGPDFAWIPGHWDFKQGQYEWTAGRWERPSNAGMIYVPGVWVPRGEGYAYISGRWDYPEENRSSVATIHERERERDRFRADERDRNPGND